MLEVLEVLARKVFEGLEREDRRGLTLTLKVKFHDFQSVTRSITFPEPITDFGQTIVAVKCLLANTEAGTKKVRLLGVSVSNFLDAKEEATGWVQLPLPFRS